MLPDVAAAACVGADPALFDHTTYPEAQLALSYCATCRIVDLCMEVVRPGKSGFDGVAAAVVWRNGYRVRSDNTTRGDKLGRGVA